MGLQALDLGVVGRPTAVGVAAQGVAERRRAAGQGLPISQGPAMQPLSHDLDAPAHAQVLHADSPQGEVQVAEHGIEEGLRKALPVRAAPQAVDHQGSVERQSIEAAVERVGNAAGLEQHGLTRLLGRARIEGCGKRLMGFLSLEHDLLPYPSVDPTRSSRHLSVPLSDETKNPSMRRTVPLVLAAALLSAACDPYGDIRGFAPAPGTVDKLEVGSQSREDVVRLVGSPSAVGAFKPNVWYYITEKQENWGPSRPWIAEQNVIQINFNEQGRGANIKYYD